MKSIAVSDDNFLRVYFSKHLEVEELRESSKKFLTDFNKKSEALLEDINADYSALEATDAIRGNTSGSKASGRVNLRRSSFDTSSTRVSHEPKSYPTAKFSKNSGKLIPDKIYVQVRDWYYKAAVQEKTPEDLKWLKNFKFKTP